FVATSSGRFAQGLAGRHLSTSVITVKTTMRKHRRVALVWTAVGASCEKPLESNDARLSRFPGSDRVISVSLRGKPREHDSLMGRSPELHTALELIPMIRA